MLGLGVVRLDNEAILQVELDKVDLVERLHIDGLELGSGGLVERHVLQDIVEGVHGVKLKGHSVGIAYILL